VNGEDAAMHRTIQHLPEGEFDLAQGDFVAVAGALFRHSEGAWQAALPFPQEAFDPVRGEVVGQLLHPSWVVTTENPVGKFFVADPSRFPFSTLRSPLSSEYRWKDPCVNWFEAQPR
jgi:hypothetical protein